MGQQRLNALAMLSIENELIHGLFDFNSKVIEKFAQMKDVNLTGESNLLLFLIITIDCCIEPLVHAWRRFDTQVSEGSFVMYLCICGINYVIIFSDV